jgi:hypothetical protein
MGDLMHPNLPHSFSTGKKIPDSIAGEPEYARQHSIREFLAQKDLRLYY